MTPAQRLAIENDIRSEVYDVKRSMRLAASAGDTGMVAYWRAELASLLDEYHARMEHN